MRFLGKGKKEDKKTAESAEVNKPRIYFATKSGISDDGTGGGLLAYRANLADRHTAVNEISPALKTEGFSYVASIGLTLEGKDNEDAKSKLLSQRDNKVSEDDLRRLEEKWIERQKAETPEKNLEKYRIPEEIRKKLIGKTGIEAEYGINLNYEAAAKALKVWQTL